MEQEELQAFNNRLSQWISSQGFWFQLRYALFGQGNLAILSYHLMQMAFRLVVFALVIGLGFGYYFYKRPEKRVFLDEMTAACGQALGAKQAQIDGFRRVQGELRINRMGAVGSPDSFFETLDVGTIHCRMGLTDGIMGRWDAGPVSARTCVIEVKAGADDKEGTKRAADALFRGYPKFQFPSIEIVEATVRWGYSERTRGQIEKSHLVAQRTDSGWKLQFRGGYFSQNWLNRIEIDELTVNIDRNGLSVEKGEFHRDSGVVSLHGVVIDGGERPMIHGKAKLKNLPLDAILPPVAKSYVEGTMSTELTLSGSTNSPEGIGFKGQVLFDGTDVLTLREKIPLLRALSVVDVFNSYKKIDFTEGSYSLMTTNGSMEVTDVDLKAKELFTMQGSLRVRRMTNEEITAEIQRSGSNGVSPIFDRNDGWNKEDGSQDEISLKRAAKEESKEKEKEKDPNNTNPTFDYIAQRNLSQEIDRQQYNRLSRQLRFDGGFLITIPPDSFERAQQLREDNPVDPATGRIPIRVPVQGPIYEITLKQADEIYTKGKRKE